MPTLKHSFENVYKNIDDIALTQNSVAMINFYLNDAKSLCKWFGDEEIINLDTNFNLKGFPIDGIFYWEDKLIWIVICNKRVFKIDANRTITELTGSNLNKNKVVYFALAKSDSTGLQYLYFCNNSVINYIEEYLTEVKTVSDTDAPTDVVRLFYVNGRIVAINKSMFLYWSDSSTFTSWTATSSSGLSDQSNIIAGCKGNSSDILCLSNRSCQIIRNVESDPPFQRDIASFDTNGIIAPDTLQYFNNSWYWLSSKRQFLKYSGSGSQIISSPINKYLQEFTTINDAKSFLMTVYGLDLYVTIFPTEKKVICWNWKNINYFELADWRNSDYDLWYGNCYEYSSYLNEHWIGSRKDCKIYKLNKNLYTHAGETIRQLYNSGNLDYGTIGKKKNISKRTYKIKTGSIDSGDFTTEPKILVKSNIDNKGLENERTLELKRIGDTHMFIEETSSINSEFITKQDEIVVSDNFPTIICEIEDEFNVEP